MSDSDKEKSLVLSDSITEIVKKVTDGINDMFSGLEQINGRIESIIQKTNKADKNIIDTLRESNSIVTSIREKIENDVLTDQDYSTVTSNLYRLIGRNGAVYLQLSEENSRNAEIAVTVVNSIMFNAAIVKKDIGFLVNKLLFYKTQYQNMVSLNEKSKEIHGMDILTLVGKSPGYTWDHGKIKKAIHRTVNEYIKNYPQHKIYKQNIIRIIYGLVKKEYLTLINPNGLGSYMNTPKELIEPAVKYVEGLSIKEIVTQIIGITDTGFNNGSQPSKSAEGVQRVNVININDHGWKKINNDLVVNFQKWLVIKCNITKKSAKDYSRCICKICVMLDVEPEMLGTVDIPKEIYLSDSNMFRKGKTAYKRFLQYLSEISVKKETPIGTTGIKG